MKQHNWNVHLKSFTDNLHHRLVATIQDLVQIPSENTPPTGAELTCQKYLLNRLEALGLPAELYELTTVDGLQSHPGFRPDRDYHERPNLVAHLRGTGGGRSLLLSGHIDTVPRGTEHWSHAPFAAHIEGNRLYGLGANDMKGGIAASLVAIEAIQSAGIKLRGDVIFETVVDEEFGGVNGTLAARLKGHNADAAIITEPSQTQICPAQMGGRIAHITFYSPDGGILEQGKEAPRVTDQIQYFLARLKEFAHLRRATAPVHSLYQTASDPVPVWVLKINAGGWGFEVPMTIPQIGRIELYWQLMPGEKLSVVDEVFFQWMKEIIQQQPDLFTIPPEVTFPIVGLPGSAIHPDAPVVTQLATTFQEVTGQRATVQGFGAPCDMFMLHQYFFTPAVLFGPSGGNTHQPDEWVDLDSAQTVLETLAQFICQWCGVAE